MGGVWGKGEAMRNWQWEGEADACPIIAHRFPLQANKGAIATVYPSRNGTIARRAGVADPGCAAAMTPQCLQDLYQIPADPATQTSNKMFVSSFVQSFASRTDLSSFLSDFRPDMASDTTFQLAVLNGGENDESRPSIEGVSFIPSVCASGALKLTTHAAIELGHPVHGRYCDRCAYNVRQRRQRQRWRPHGLPQPCECAYCYGRTAQCLHHLVRFP